MTYVVAAYLLAAGIWALYLRSIGARAARAARAKHRMLDGA